MAGSGSRCSVLEGGSGVTVHARELLSLSRLRLAFFINVILLPGFLFSLGWYINRKVGPLWSSCRWLQPECQFQTEGRLDVKELA